ncbi:patatin-like phospholipase family protein [Corallococcus aberystwythensis]|uniref:Patatin-like phospholipase family protein n=1 Tax=Corallococcus aberystwythensis TaxID=2316722 RepID=A0A3A8Q736_9BACT|nr:patatin-like phospholipase family protein [Corallococcus aberystwythensis]RKH60672.1 patatin-like phospholipase family protein [Corallococcus aberystwythensis]
MRRHLTPLLMFLAATASGCSFMRTDVLLDTLNTPDSSKPEDLPVRVPAVERVAGLTRAQLTDSYVDPARAGAWMEALGAAPESVLDMTACLVQHAGNDTASCYENAERSAYVDRTVKVSAWGVPLPVQSFSVSAPAAEEVDAQRFLANAMGIGPSLAALQQSLEVPLTREVLAQGIQRGAASAAAYVRARSWRRDLQRPSNAVVLSGGGANGAFSAGAIWRLLGILEQCRGKPAPEGCGDARIDLAAGTSTGALISTLVDLFHTPGQEANARKQLLGNYTCTVESDLYCVNSTWLWSLAEDTRGLVKFDGIYSKLDAFIQPEMLHNGTELVSVSVDFQTGDVFSVSDQDPADFKAGASDKIRKGGMTHAIVASIAEPVLSNPVSLLPSASGDRTGTYYDGGVRSGLPLLQAVQRGAERVLVISTGGVNPSPAADPKNAMNVLMRTIDLFVAQPRVGEVQQAELLAVTRRLGEYNVCTLRGATEDFCRRKGPGFQPPSVGPGAGQAVWMGSARFDQVASSWRSAWMFKPETGLATASGYSFTPEVMQPLFVAGVESMQKRCTEVLSLFDIQGTLAAKECARQLVEVADEAREALPSVAQCRADKPARRTCD